MAEVLENVLIAFAVVTVMLACDRLRNKGLRIKENRMFFIYALSSAIWSFFFGKLIIQTEPYAAYVCRSLGMIGTFATLISITWLLAMWSEIKGYLRVYICGFSLLGIVIFPFNVSESATIFKMTKFGMSYEFVPDFWVTAYNLYCVIVGLNLAIMIVLMLQKGRKMRVRIMGKYMLGCELAVVFGMVFDTILPVFGFAALPGSTITQFFGAIIMWFAIKFSERTQVSSGNLSDFIFSSMKTPMLIYDDKENLKMVSESATEIFGIDANSRKLKIDDIFEMPESMRELKDTKTTFEAKCLLRDMYCSVEVNRVEDSFKDVIGYIVVITDLTQKMEFIHNLEDARESADRANASKSRFLANMSHEIRTPINTVLGMNEMILRECEEPNIEEYALNIKDSGETLLNLINDILDFSKIEAGMLEVHENEYTMSSLLKGIHKSFALKADEKGLEFYVEAEDYLYEEMFGDEVKMRQILTNLLSNAVKYTPKGKVCLWVGLDDYDYEDRVATLAIKVSDTGIGIKEADADKIFYAFERFDEDKNRNIEGNGLGLSIVRRIVDMFDGDISFESIYGSGTVFTVKVKQKVRSSERIGSIDFNKTVLHKESKKYSASFTAPEAEILVVDDNIANIKVMEALLKQTQVKIDVARDGKECVEAVRKKRYDVIFLDHMMPVMDGIEAMRIMKKDMTNMSKEAPVIALTANAIQGMREMYLQEGFDDYLSKPVVGADLEKMLYEYLPESLTNKK